MRVQNRPIKTLYILKTFVVLNPTQAGLALVTSNQRVSTFAKLYICVQFESQSWPASRYTWCPLDCGSHKKRLRSENVCLLGCSHGNGHKTEAALVLIKPARAVTLVSLIGVLGTSGGTSGYYDLQIISAILAPGCSPARR